MNLILTDPILADTNSFHNLISEPDIQRQFLNFRNRDLDETKREIETWVANRAKFFPLFLRMVKITEDESAQSWDDTNSELIGFISNVNAGQTDNLYSGFKVLMNYAIRKKFENKGIMTAALEMTLQRMYELNYNIASAFIKPGNNASERVLIKCGFDLVKDTPMGKSYVKALKIDLNKYNSEFGL